MVWLQDYDALIEDGVVSLPTCKISDAAIASYVLRRIIYDNSYFKQVRCNCFLDSLANRKAKSLTYNRKPNQNLNSDYRWTHRDVYLFNEWMVTSRSNKAINCINTIIVVTHFISPHLQETSLLFFFTCLSSNSFTVLDR